MVVMDRFVGFLRAEGRYESVYVNTEQILWVEVTEDNTELFTCNGSIEVQEPLDVVVARLNGNEE